MKDPLHGQDLRRLHANVLVQGRVRHPGGKQPEGRQPRDVPPRLGGGPVGEPASPEQQDAEPHAEGDGLDDPLGDEPGEQRSFRLREMR